MDPVAKALLNILRCPICKGQLDLLSLVANPKKSKEYRHYGIFLVHWEYPIRIEQEGVTIFEGSHQFDIEQKGGRTTISIYEIDPEERILDNIKPKIFTYDKELFTFHQTTRDKIVNRIKTILVFQ
jgi:uncharacterized protein YbaR (Trm112 family)